MAAQDPVRACFRSFGSAQKSVPPDVTERRGRRMPMQSDEVRKQCNHPTAVAGECQNLLCGRSGHSACDGQTYQICTKQIIKM